MVFPILPVLFSVAIDPIYLDPAKPGNTRKISERNK